jgi:hypothetical protein
VGRPSAFSWGLRSLSPGSDLSVPNQEDKLRNWRKSGGELRLVTPLGFNILLVLCHYWGVVVVVKRKKPPVLQIWNPV